MTRRTLGFLALLLVASVCGAAIFRPVFETHRSAALEAFKPVDGSFKSLEEAYKALRSFQILGIGENLDISTSTCGSIVETLKSSSADLKDVYFALKANQILKCSIDTKSFKVVTSRLQAAIGNASSLLDFYYSVGGLLLVKDLAADLNIQLENADQVFRSVKALGQSDGRWRYNSDKPEASIRAAGIALETLAGVISLGDVDQSSIGTVKNDVVKLFDSIEKYDDGAMFFDEKVVDAQEYQGPLSTTASFVRGLVAFANANPEKIDVSGDKILGLAKFLLGVGVPGNPDDFFDQIDALALLEKNRTSIPLILSLPATVLSLTRNDQLKVKVTTVLSSDAPPLTVKILQAASSELKNSPIIENQDLKFNADGGFHLLDALPKDADIGIYEFVFKIALHDSTQNTNYATGGRTRVKVYFTGVVTVDDAEISVLDRDGSVESQKTLDFSADSSISLSANHLQKMRLSFKLSSPLGNAFKPHQALLKLRHETKVEHVFVVGNKGKKFEMLLDFLGLVDKLYYLSGKYDIQLTVGDAVMENSFSRSLGHIDLDLPQPPEKATRPPPQPVDTLSRFGPKAEITHIFRAPEKRPPKELSVAFLGLTLVPLAGFLFGLLRLGVNFQKFPKSGLPAIFAILFHVGIGAVLSLYLLFWLKLNLFTTLKVLGFLGVFLLFVGHRTLSYLASTSAKVKSA